MEILNWLSGIVSTWCQVLQVNCKFCSQTVLSMDGWSNWSTCLNGSLCNRVEKQETWLKHHFDQRLKSHYVSAQSLQCPPVTLSCVTSPHCRVRRSANLTLVMLMTNRIIVHCINISCHLTKYSIFQNTFLFLEFW